MTDKSILPSENAKAIVLSDNEKGNWWHKVRLFSLLQPMQEVVRVHADGIAEDMQERVGLVRLSGETKTLAKAHVKSKWVEESRVILAIALNMVLSGGLILSKLIGGASNDALVNQAFGCFLIFIIMFPITWITIVALFPLQKYNIMLTAAQEGWHAQLLQACHGLATNGVVIPPAISVLVPSLSGGNPSLTVLRQLGDVDTAAMFAFTDAMTAEAARAQKAKERLQVPPPLLLAGETGELLCRVSSALDVDAEDYSAPRVI